MVMVAREGGYSSTATPRLSFCMYSGLENIRGVRRRVGAEHMIFAGLPVQVVPKGGEAVLVYLDR